MIPARARSATVALVLIGAMALPGCTSSAPYLLAECVREDLQGKSVARVWNEAMLDAIRRDVPAPTVHARNLFHVSAAMWDAWAAYDSDAAGYFVNEELHADDVTMARETAMSYAAYRILLHRYSIAAGMEETFHDLSSTMASLCYRIDYAQTEGDGPADVGNRIAAHVIRYGRHDGSLEDQRYIDTNYEPANAPMVVADPGTTMRDPNRWQPLALDQLVAQNGLPIPGSVQRYIGPHWGRVRGFALPTLSTGMPLDPGPPPQLGETSDGAFKWAAVQVIRYSNQLDATNGSMIDIGPGALGDNPLGTNAGDGHDLNPETGKPYAPNPVPLGDFARALAEFWADGPDSETPPGHWNTIANAVSNAPSFDHRVGGHGSEIGRLEWDVKLYFALNGALHDAAVAAWGVKGHYDSARPISMIRYMGGRGQSSDPRAPGYDRDGLPLVPGLIEVVTPGSSSTGERHEHLVRHVGEVAVRSWLGSPRDPTLQTAGVGWARAVDWVPYQRPTFVTPAFAGYVSGHSTFSRAAAEVLTAFTGAPTFPGGVMEWRIPAGSLVYEEGPTRDLVLQWATYFDAADQAGLSHLYGGIHIAADDFAGREVGAACGRDAWALALRYFNGSIA